MMSSNRQEYGSAAEWLSALRRDEAWLRQEQILQQSSPDDYETHLAVAKRRSVGSLLFEYWEIYHQAEPALCEVWDIAELTLPKLKMQAIGMLSLEWLEQHAEPADQSKGAKKQKKAQAGTPQKPRETMTLGKKSGVTDGHMTILYHKLVREEWIEGNEADFKALFSGKRDEDCQLTWKGLYGKGTLVELFKRFVAEGLVTVADGFTLPAILEGHFKDANGAWLTGLDKGNSANDKALPIIKECIKLLKASPDQLIRGGYDDDDDFKSEYDPYDHQDLNLHKR